MDPDLDICFMDLTDPDPDRWFTDPADPDSCFTDHAVLDLGIPKFYRN